MNTGNFGSTLVYVKLSDSALYVDQTVNENEIEPLFKQMTKTRENTKTTKNIYLITIKTTSTLITKVFT